MTHRHNPTRGGGKHHAVVSQPPNHSEPGVPYSRHWHQLYLWTQRTAAGLQAAAGCAVAPTSQGGCSPCPPYARRPNVFHSYDSSRVSPLALLKLQASLVSEKTGRCSYPGRPRRRRRLQKQRVGAAKAGMKAHRQDALWRGGQRGVTVLWGSASFLVRKRSTEGEDKYGKSRTMRRPLALRHEAASASPTPSDP